MLGDVCAIVMGGHHRPLSSLAVLIVTILVIEQSLFVAASQINQTAAAYQVNINSVCHGFRRTKQDYYFQVTFDHF